MYGVNKPISSLILLLASLSYGNAFAPITPHLRPSSSISLMNEVSELGTMSSITSSNMLLSEFTKETLGEAAKSLVIILAFGGGLIPAAIAANKSLVGTLSGKRRGGEEGSTAEYITDSGATGPEIPNSFLLFASEKIPLVDIIAIIGRIGNTDSIADWRNLPSTKDSSPTNPVMWLPRKMFKENVRSSKFLGWPVDENGEPIGGKELENAEKKRISQKNVVIGDAALDAVFDTWAWGASVATPDKVEQTLNLYRKDTKSLDLGEFVNSAARGRAVTGLGAFTFVFIQVIAYGTLFVAPALRVFFDIDIGFGLLGSCAGDCKSLL